jgi:DNA-binding PadR family transcriptional regulator
MQSAIEVDGHSLDRVSQQLLLALEGADDPPLGTGKLAGAVDATNQQVLYRMDTHLLAGEWVAERHPDRDARYFELTATGEALLEEHREALDAPRTVEEACDVAADAREVAADAHEATTESRSAIEDLEDRVDDLAADLGTVEDAASEEYLDQVDQRLVDLEEEVETLRETASDAGDLDERLSDLEADYTQVRSVTKDVYGDAEETRRLRTAGLLGRLRWLLTGSVPEA